MAQTRIDELNILGNNSSEVFDREEFIDHYFDTMQISEKQKKERIEAAQEIFDAVLFFLIWCENAPERVEEENTLNSFENLYKEVIFQHVEPDDYIDSYVHLYIANLIKVTLDHLGEEYYTSVERAANVAANESNLVVGYSEWQKAILLGYKKKQWKSEKDLKVRPTHRDVDDTILPIQQPFLVGNSLMLFPKDQYTYDADPEEIINCRCCCKYF